MSNFLIDNVTFLTYKIFNSWLNSLFILLKPLKQSWEKMILISYIVAHKKKI
jgi:hypothetical protein